MTPEDIALVLTENTKGVPHVAAMADICGGQLWPIALQFARHLPESEGELLADTWDTDGKRRVCWLFAVWCAHELSDHPLPDGLAEEPYFEGNGE